ncbi:MAG: hypothetical protein KBS39_02835, partial [Lachnospiraceae bacterium]|nr:hypothetical protein [Candidatus Hippenecus merdae]
MRKDAAAESRLRGRAIKNEIDRKNRIYSAAEARFELSFSEEAQKEAAELFAVIPGWRDSDKKRQTALERAESIRNETQYKNAVKLAEKGDARSLEEAAESMKQIADWQDAIRKAKEFEQAYSEVARKEREKKEYQERTERNRKAYDEQFSELLSGEEEVTLSLLKAEERLKTLEGSTGIKNLLLL